MAIKYWFALNNIARASSNCTWKKTQSLGERAFSG